VVANGSNNPKTFLVPTTVLVQMSATGRRLR
jgi:hypothetical protein